jgi:cytochrome b
LDEKQVLVWDRVVRGCHWLLAAGIAAAWLTRHGWGRWHEWIGYAVLAVVATRVAWGLIGTRFARFAQFVRGPRATLRHAADVIARREPRHLGHNPLGAWMILALLASTALAGLTGWLYTTDAFWGDERMEVLHWLSASAVLVLVPLHVAGVVLASVRHRESLVAAMLHGRKRAPSERDVT